IDKGEELQEEYGYFMPQQFNNEANPEVHAQTTGQEIVEQMQDGVDAFIAGIGTGGTITGAERVIKEHVDEAKDYAVEPKDSADISRGKPRPHKLQGIGAGYVPKIVDNNNYDQVMQISTEEAYETARQVATTNGILSGVSAGAAVAAAKKIAKKLGKSKKILA